MAPASVDLKTPLEEVPAYTIAEEDGSMTMAGMWLSVSPALASVQVAPESMDLKRPRPVPAKRVAGFDGSIAIA